MLLAEHKRDRTIYTRLSDNLPGYPLAGALAAEFGECPEPIRYGYRTLDRSWIVPDKTSDQPTEPEPVADPRSDDRR